MILNIKARTENDQYHIFYNKRPGAYLISKLTDVALKGDYLKVRRVIYMKFQKSVIVSF